MYLGTLFKADELSSIELMAGIFAACVPTYRPLIQHWTDRYWSRVAKRSSRDSNPASSPHGLGASRGRFAKNRLDSIEMMDKAASSVDSESKGSHWVQIREYEESSVMGV